MPPSRLHPHNTDRDRDREEKKGKGPALRISLVIFKWALSGIMQKLPQSDQNHAHNNKHYVMGKRKGKWQRNGKGNGKFHSKSDCNSLGRWTQLNRMESATGMQGREREEPRSVGAGKLILFNLNFYINNGEPLKRPPQKFCSNFYY